MQDRYVELMNFKIEVLNILETKAYELSEEKKVPVIKIFLDLESVQLINFYPDKKREMHD